jgi:hypothetical protein
MSRLNALNLLAALLVAWTGCSEPDRAVSSTTGDNLFSLRLEAQKQWVRPGGVVPVRVRVERLGGPPPEDVEGQVQFAVNNGAVSPSLLQVKLAAPDSAGQGGERVFAEWVIFTARTTATAQDQGEIHALFRDAVATLKIRIVPAF